MGIRVLYIAEIIGKAGVFCVKKILPDLKKRVSPDFVIACGNSVTSGAGIGRAHSVYLRKLGIDVITTGEAAFYKKDIVDAFPKSPWLLRPYNYPPGVPGRGLNVYRTQKGPLAVVQLLGQSGFSRIHLDNPFRLLDALLAELVDIKTIILDFRAATTAERQAMFYYGDGRLSAILGSYGRAISADASISPKNTAFMTDTGRTGSLLSVGGLDAERKIAEYRSGVPSWPKDAHLLPELQGCLIDIDDDGRAESIETLRIPCKEEFHEGTRDSNKD